MLTPSTTSLPEPETPDLNGQGAAENSKPKLETAELPEIGFRLDSIDVRDRALPVRQGDLTRLLLAEPGMSQDDREKLAQFARLLGAMFHSELYECLCELKERYAPLDPDSDYVPLADATATSTETSDEEFLVPFEKMLARANYQALPLDVIEKAITAPNEMGLTYVPDFSLFEHIRVYVRGFTTISRECRNLTTRFRKRRVSMDAYQRMVVALKFKAGKNLGPLARSDVVYLRLFKDVPHVDMEMHLPEQGTKVRMRNIDKAQIASPIAIAIPTLIAKVMFASLVSPFAFGGLLAAPISAGLNSFFGFQREAEASVLDDLSALLSDAGEQCVGFDAPGRLR